MFGSAAVVLFTLLASLPSKCGTTAGGVGIECGKGASGVRQECVSVTRIFGHLWQVLASCGHLWYVLASCGMFWHLPLGGYRMFVGR
jgi:hypothetical protein